MAQKCKHNFLFENKTFFCETKLFFLEQNILLENKSLFLKTKLSLMKKIYFMKQKRLLKITFLFENKTFFLKEKLFFKTTLVSLVSSKQMRIERILIRHFTTAGAKLELSCFANSLKHP